MSQTYTIISVEDTTFEPDQYGNVFYSVKFEGWDGKVLWKTPKRPENNTQVYGSISPSKSGKAMIFKKEKKEDWRDGGNTPVAEPNNATTAPQTTSSTDASTQNNRNDEIRWQVAIKEANAYVTKNRADLDAYDWAKEVNQYANSLYAIADKPGGEALL